jgi:xanthine dehydrogenase accessory factor
MPDIHRELARLTAAGKAAVLARIIRQEGSAPRAVGTRMLMREDGTLAGTIGGGLLEHQTLLRAREVMDTGRSAVLHVRLSGKDVSAGEMICGGDVEVFLEAFSGRSTAAGEVFGRAAELVKQGRRGILISCVAEGLENSAAMLAADDGTVHGSLVGPGGPITVDPAQWVQLRRPVLTRLDDHPGRPRLFVEPIEPEAVLYLFGAGHVSTCVAPLAGMVGFRVCVIDDRPEFANRERFPGADEIRVERFAEAFRKVSVTPADFIAVITRGHAHDQDVLREALKTPAVYIGMIGSLRKRDMIYRSLLSEGVSRAELDRVHSPIGVDIRAESPEEIAVSIVAELIRVRAEGAVRRVGAAGSPR